MKYRRYAEYKDSGVEWLGEVPAHWEVLSLGKVTKLQRGHDLPEPLRKEGPYPVVTSSGPSGYHNEYQAKAPGVVTGRYGTIGGIYFIEEDFWPLNTSLYAIDFFGNYPRFIYYMLMNLPFGMYSDKSAVPGVNRNHLHTLAVARPPVSEQLKIVCYLDSALLEIDALIAKQERLIAVLQEKRQALISHAVTKGLNPDAPMKNSGVEWLGEVPAHWAVKRLKHIAGIQTGVAKGRDLSGQETIYVPYMRVANVQAGYLDLDDIATIEIARSELDRYRLQPGDVLMNEGGDNDKLGRGSIWRGEINPCIHQNHVFAVRPHGVEPEWLTLVTGSDYAKFYFYSVAKQSTNLASISSSNLREVPILCPPESERNEIRAYVAAKSAKNDLLLKKVNSAIEELKERRSALISAAVTGKIDVRC